ncbi:MAG TPA: RNA polymerase sigma factor [Candidatus Angelobacter sp.]|nr:RNA polymerase sigma factor [Candidatus Angelobacter sp.]
MTGNRDAGNAIELALRKSARGDNPAFAEIVQEHQRMVFSIAYHFLQDRALAEDLAQEVFLSLYQHLRDIQSPEHLKYWLRRVTSHRCIDQKRRRRQELTLEEAELPAPEANTVPNDPMLAERLQKSVALLPERQRIVVILRYQEGMGPGEISEALNMPVNTVKSTLHRALADLRKKLERKIGEARYAFF